MSMRGRLQNIGIAGMLIATMLLLIGVAIADKAPPGGDARTLPPKIATLLGLRCLGCHNPAKKAGGIDMTTRDAALAGNVFVPREPDQSRAVRMVEQGKMPPDGKLPDAEIALLRRWIADGATYPREKLEAIQPVKKPLWSFQPLKMVSPPHSRFDALSANPVDRFLFAKIEQAGLHPSPPADRPALLRRVTFDLTGLPPTPQEIDAFLADHSPNAYEKVVDRLLASPAYGERWGRHWLDVVRYGESHGYEQNHLRPNAWPYRDYVIRSFNADKPFNQFVTEQLAGDIVGKGDPETEVATGFLVAGIHDTVGNQTEEGTRQQRANDLDDMVSTTGAAFLGLTVNCAKCHDHKFDPIPSRDYYRLTAVFSGVRHGDRQLSASPLTPAQQQELDQIRRQIGQDTAQMAQLKQTLLLRTTVRHRPAVNARHNEDGFAPVPARFVRFTVLATNDGSEPCLDELEVYGPDGVVNLALAKNGAKAIASSLLPGYAIHQIAHLNDGLYGNSHSWISNERGKGWAQIELPKQATVSLVVWERDTEGQFNDRVPTSYRIEVSLDGQNWKSVATGEDRATEQRELSDDDVVKALPPAQSAQYRQLLADRETRKLREQQLNPVKVAYCGQFTDPDPAYLLQGGDVMRRGEQLTPGALSQVPTLPSDLTQYAVLPASPVTRSAQHTVSLQQAANAGGQAGATDPRLELARWICDPRNPLTARVIVNRIWEHHFGIGIVDTPSDFGNIGSLPSHPELLDWLANDFMTHGWRLKRLHRMLVTSYCYRQASAVTPQGQAKDADNRLLWRMPLRRMEAEAVRDAILATSGKLDRTMGGPGFPLFKYSVVNVAIYEPREDQGPDTWRRSVYQIPARGIRDDLLGNFDCPDSSERTPHRTSTTTALQALSMLNSKFITQQAGFFAERVTQTGGAMPSGQVRTAFRLAFGRAPSSEEGKAAQALLVQDGLPTLCRALLNANEFLYY